jgi:hypothetical protein
MPTPNRETPHPDRGRHRVGGRVDHRDSAGAEEAIIRDIGVFPLLYAGAASGGGRSCAMSRRMSANNCREMATSAI